jgi:hypothetical protein
MVLSFELFFAERISGEKTMNMGGVKRKSITKVKKRF